ncbi:MAG TPA: hypothetical protein PK322_04515 [Opitutaceae bacterium]|nr:hypothetical protein [Opitutaceae bacterium]
MKHRSGMPRTMRQPIVLLGAFTSFLGWATYSIWTTQELTLGTILFGSLLSAGALWNAFLFGAVLVSQLRRKKPINPAPETTRGGEP